MSKKMQQKLNGNNIRVEQISEDSGVSNDMAAKMN